MQIKIYWDNTDTTELLNRINISVEELWLTDFVNVVTSFDEWLKNELNISKQPALVIEEESIDFKDMIFEWIVPEVDELKSMFISIIGWWDSASWWCGWWSCWSWCSC